MGQAVLQPQSKNVVPIQGFKEYVALLFFKGSVLPDPKHLLIPPGQSRAARQLRFTNADDITAKKATIRAARTFPQT